MYVKFIFERGNMDIRALEKTNKIGYIFDIFYNGKYFDSFDEQIRKRQTNRKNSYHCF